MLKKSDKLPIFVVQEHDASHLHYDFRLEHDGVLKSWALPKGPTVNPGDKHLAVATPDHDLDYADFEGIIPEGHYGAGSVIVWDTGTFENLKTKSLDECLKEGKLEFRLHGKKLKGDFALIKTKYKNNTKNWLLIKLPDKYAKDSPKNFLNRNEKSVISKKTLEDLNKKINKK